MKSETVQEKEEDHKKSSTEEQHKEQPQKATLPPDYELALAAMQTGNIQAAETLFRALLEDQTLTDKDILSDIHLQLAHIVLLQERSPEKAIVELRKAVSHKATNYTAQDRMGLCFVQLQQFENARICFQKCAGHDPTARVKVALMLYELEGSANADQYLKDNPFPKKSSEETPKTTEEENVLNEYMSSHRNHELGKVAVNIAFYFINRHMKNYIVDPTNQGKLQKLAFTFSFMHDIGVTNYLVSVWDGAYQDRFEKMKTMITGLTQLDRSQLTLEIGKKVTKDWERLVKGVNFTATQSVGLGKKAFASFPKSVPHLPSLQQVKNGGESLVKTTKQVINSLSKENISKGYSTAKSLMTEENVTKFVEQANSVLEFSNCLLFFGDVLCAVENHGLYSDKYKERLQQATDIAQKARIVHRGASAFVKGTEGVLQLNKVLKKGSFFVGTTKLERCKNFFNHTKPGLKNVGGALTLGLQAADLCIDKWLASRSPEDKPDNAFFHYADAATKTANSFWVQSVSSVAAILLSPPVAITVVTCFTVYQYLSTANELAFNAKIEKIDFYLKEGDQKSTQDDKQKKETKQEKLLKTFAELEALYAENDHFYYYRARIKKIDYLIAKGDVEEAFSVVGILDQAMKVKGFIYEEPIFEFFERKLAISLYHGKGNPVKDIFIEMKTLFEKWGASRDIEENGENSKTLLKKISELEQKFYLLELNHLYNQGSFQPAIVYAESLIKRLSNGESLAYIEQNKELLFDIKLRCLLQLFRQLKESNLLEQKKMSLSGLIIFVTDTPVLHAKKEEIYALIARNFIESDYYTDALLFFEILLTKEPLSDTLILYKCEALFTLAKLQTSEAESSVLKSAESGLVDFVDALYKLKNDKKNSLMVSANQYLDEAKKLLLQLINHDRENVAAHVVLAQIYLFNEEFSKSVSYYEIAIKLTQKQVLAITQSKTKVSKDNENPVYQNLKSALEFKNGLQAEFDSIPLLMERFIKNANDILNVLGSEKLALTENLEALNEISESAKKENPISQLLTELGKYLNTYKYWRHQYDCGKKYLFDDYFQKVRGEALGEISGFIANMINSLETYSPAPNISIYPPNSN